MTTTTVLAPATRRKRRARLLAQTQSPADRKLRVINLIAVLLPFAGLITAMVLLWETRALDAVHLVLLWVMATITALGVTVGYHRLCTHRSFKTSGVIRYLFAAAGSMAVQGPVIQWCGEHRRHHQHSDTEDDPHSPHMHRDGSWGEGLWATLRGAYHAHVGWLFEGRPKGLGKYTKDLRADPAIAAASRHFPALVLAGLLVPAIIGGLVSMSWLGALLGFLWGGLIRVLLVHHITWSVNSICHLWGTRPYRTHDHSRNNAIVGLLALGEGWHNNHHAFPASARHGLRWWEIDFSYWVIRTMGMLGLATEIRVPAAAVRDRKRRTAGESVDGTTQESADLSDPNG